jgi:hypothetical protein
MSQKLRIISTHWGTAGERKIAFGVDLPFGEFKIRLKEGFPAEYENHPLAEMLKEIFELGDLNWVEFSKEHVEYQMKGGLKGDDYYNERIPEILSKYL